jgi:predicted dehydrogenase
VVAASDPNPEALTAFARTEGLRPYEDHRDLLAQEAPELAIILGTPREMPGYTLDALAAGAAVAVEKPLAVDAPSLEPVMRAAEGRFVAVALANRYSGVWKALASMEGNDQAGPRQHASFRLLNGFPERYRRDGVAWVLDPSISGGGCLRNLGIHAVDAFLEFCRGEAVTVERAELSRGFHDSGVEDHAFLVLRSASGIVGTVEAAYTFPTLGDGGDYEWRLATRNSYLIERSLPGRAVTLESFLLDEQPGWQATTPLGERYDAFAQDTVRRLRGGEPPRAGLDDLHRAMLVIDRAYALAGGQA